jgi:hypothetical protein
MKFAIDSNFKTASGADRPKAVIGDFSEKH